MKNVAGGATLKRKTAWLLVMFFLLGSCGKNDDDYRETGRIRYKLILKPEEGVVLLEGHIPGLRGDSLAWQQEQTGGTPAAGAPDRVSNAPDGISFGSVINLSEGESRTGANTSRMDKRHFRAWGGDLIPTPVNEAVFSPVTLEIEGPEGWAIASSRGIMERHFKLPTLRDLRGMALVAGDYQMSEGRLANQSLFTMVRSSFPIPEPEIQNGLRELMVTALAFWNARLPGPVTVVVDHLDGDSTGVFARNIPTGGQISIQMLCPQSVSLEDPDFYRTFSRAFNRTWIPVAFGNPDFTEAELGPTFIEGFHDYVALRIAHYSGLLSDENFARVLSAFYLDYLAAGGEGKQRNVEVPAAIRGKILAFILDLQLHQGSGGQYGIRDFMRSLLQRYHNEHGLKLDDLLAVVEDLGGLDLATRYEKIYQSRRLPALATYLPESGIVLQSPGKVSGKMSRAVLEGRQEPLFRFSPQSEAERDFLATFLGRSW